VGALQHGLCDVTTGTLHRGRLRAARRLRVHAPRPRTSSSMGDWAARVTRPTAPANS
jgi:hypothetical protein